jgi:hypothetical protein
MSTLAASFLDDNGLTRFDGTITTRNPIVAGALPTVALSSGTAAQVSATRNATAAILYTLDATNNVATVKIELSPDNSTFTSLGTMSFAAAVNNTGAIALIASVPVPAGWYIKVTVVHAAITSTTYY